MNAAMRPQSGPRRRKIAGLNVGDRAGGLASILAILDSRSTRIEDYVPPLKAAAAAEFKDLAELLLSCMDDNSLKGRGAYQTDDHIEIFRDEVKTMLLAKVPQMGLEFSAVRSDGGSSFSRTQLSLLANDACFMFLGSGTMQLRHLEVVPDSDGEELRHSRVVSYSGGDVATIRRGEDAFETMSVNGTIWLLQLIINEHSDLVSHYDRHSLRRTGVSSASVHASRLEFAMDILARFPAEGALDRLEMIYETSRFYFVRWKAVKTLLRLDLQRGAGVLMRARSDAHPQVRAAADRTIQSLRQHGHI